MPPVACLFEPGVTASQSYSLEKLIREHVDQAVRDLNAKRLATTSTAAASAATATTATTVPSVVPHPGDLLSEMGDYLSWTAMLWAYLTENLLKSSGLEQAMVRAHERSRAQSAMSDLSEVARIDVEIARLRYGFPFRPWRSHHFGEPLELGYVSSQK